MQPEPPQHCYKEFYLGFENQTTILKNLTDIEKFRKDWENWQFYPNSDIDFYLHVINAREATVTPFVIIIGPTEKPLAIAIGRKERGFTDMKAGYKTLWRVKSDVIVIMHNGFIGETNTQTAQLLINALWRCLKQKEADAVRFELLARNSMLLNTIQANTPFLCRNQIFEYRAHWKLAVPTKINDLYERLSSNHRNQLRRLTKKIEHDFPGPAIYIKCLQKPGELDRLFNDVELIAKQTYQRSLGAGFIDNDENKSRLALEAKRGWLRMNVLYINNEPCAYWWGIVYKNIFYSCALGYVPEYQNYSAGMYLIIKTLESLCGKDITHVDFGPGDARYKQQFGDEQYEETSITLFAPNLKSMALNTALSANNAVIFYLKILLNRFKIGDKLKKHWRNKLKKSSSFS
ncbi:hypothetical protein MCAMS1_01300 [biofilm metagenome]